MTTMRDHPVLETEVLGLRRLAPAGCADLYELDDELLVVATDRVIERGQVLPTGIPGKGQAVCQLAAFWFAETRSIAPSHFITADSDQVLRVVSTWGGRVDPHLLQDRALLVNRARPIPVQGVVYGYLAGAAWEAYRASGHIGEQTVPGGLAEGERLPFPLFAPLTEAGGDERLTWHDLQHLAGPGHARELQELSVSIYSAAEAHARSRRLCLAEARLEFGLFQGMLLLSGLPLTPDSDVYWDADAWRPGRRQADFARQSLLDYLDSVRWDGQAPAPELPPDVVDRVRARYVETLERLTGVL
jgi:phosphoribosylaminoimidazole-succinocarboxamide synthase